MTRVPLVTDVAEVPDPLDIEAQLVADLVADEPISNRKRVQRWRAKHAARLRDLRVIWLERRSAWQAEGPDGRRPRQS